MTAELIHDTANARPGDEVWFTLLNHGPGMIASGYNTRLEQYADGDWIGCYYSEDQAVVGIAPTLFAGERRDLSVLIPPGAPPGRFRVTQPITASDGSTIELWFELNVAP